MKTARINPGDVFERLTVVSRADNAANAGHSVRWNCICECGEKTVVFAQCLRTGKTKSCGCFRREVTSVRWRKHGMTETQTYYSWGGMVSRCTNKNDERWKWYGGRGIKVCDRWLVFSAFFEDMGEAPPRMTIERIDVDGNYEPGNCRWATKKEQKRNTTATRWVELDGQRLSLSEWCERKGVKYSLARDRLNRGWPVERVFA